ncbi:MAG: hypothetical protein ACTHJT_00485 [Cytophaga sp.]|uniref:hypothetical protein n=1 Tax=Cytophaga sp. TaxID=29535 RepID=UPI003F7FF0F5
MTQRIITYIFFSICLFTALLSSAQNAESEYELLVKKAQNIYSAVDTAGNYVFVFQTSKNLEVTFFDRQNKKQSDLVLTIPPQITRDAYLGTQLTGDSCTIYFFSEHTRGITQLSVNRQSGNMLKRTVGQLPYSSKFLKSFFLNDTFYILTATSGKNELTLHAVSENKLNQTTFGVEMPDMYKRLGSGNNLLNEEPEATLGIDRVNYKVENNVKSARATKKIYTFGNNIYLIFDDPDYTSVIHIDVVKSTCTYKQFVFNQNKGNHSSKKQGNSFLFEDKLFRVTMTPEQLTFTVLNVDSNNTYATFYATPQNVIDFKNGAIIQENSSDKQRVLEDTQEFFKKALASNLSISVNRKDSIYVVEIGSYEEYVSGGYGNSPNAGNGPNFSIGMGMGMGYGGMGMGYGGMGMGYGGMGGMGMGNYGYGAPGYYNGYSGYYPYNSTTTTIRTIYFHSMIDSASFQQEPGIVPISLRERVSNFETAMFKDKTPELIRIVDLEDRIIIGYLITAQNTFKTYSFYK